MLHGVVVFGRKTLPVTIMPSYDAILVPGGGVRESGLLPSWVRRRLDLAVQIREESYIVTLSAGTTRRPPPLDAGGYPIFESVAAARYLVAAGVPPHRVLAETHSYDTIGNALCSERFPENVSERTNFETRRVLLDSSNHRVIIHSWATPRGLETEMESCNRTLRSVANTARRAPYIMSRTDNTRAAPALKKGREQRDRCVTSNAFPIHGQCPGGRCKQLEVAKRTLCGTLAFNADTITLAKAGTYSDSGSPLQAGCRSMSHMIFLQQVSHALQRRPLYCDLRLDMHSHALDKL
jgi:hypothetical protein